MMPKMDGIELTRRVRQSASSDPAIIFLSALDAEQGKDYAIEAGADRFISKPYQAQEILDCLTDLRAIHPPHKDSAEFSKADVKILVAEDDPLCSKLVENLLTEEGYSVTVSPNGLDALDQVEHADFDVLLLDWLMPKLDGVELTRRVRASHSDNPSIIIMSAINSEASRQHAIEVGANQFLSKPLSRQILLESLSGIRPTHHKKHNLKSNGPVSPIQEYSNHQDPEPNRSHPTAPLPPFAGVCVAAGTNGSLLLCELFRSIPPNLRAAFFITLYGPAWVAKDFASRLQRETSMRVRMVEDGICAKRGEIYVTAGGRYLFIEPSTFRLRLMDVHPTADPFFSSAATAFGRFCTAVMMSSLRIDHPIGLTEVATLGGEILEQDSETSTSLSMLSNRIEWEEQLKSEHNLILFDNLASTITQHVTFLSDLLKDAGGWSHQMQAR
jgi:DNA-binding response OmpR family regulator